MQQHLSFPERLARSTKEPGECWDWFGYRDRDGYGRVTFDGWSQLAHRVAYRHVRGPIPEGLTIDHLCRNRACVNPDHLEAVTQAVNTLRGNAASAINARKTHCKWGHEFTPENTYLYRGRTRTCRACGRIQNAKAAARRKAA